MRTLRQASETGYTLANPQDSVLYKRWLAHSGLGHFDALRCSA